MFILGLVDEKANNICTCGYDVDHIDHNKLNNQRSNLRICRGWQNNKNQIKSKPTATSKYLGVSYVKKRNMWLAQISDKNKTKNLGVYASEVEAAIAYNNAVIKFHGEFANLNKI